jgi:opacity protein-like surface antigen
MRLRFVVLALALTAVTVGAHAQIGLYVNPVATRISISTPDTGPFAFLGENTTSRYFGGVAIGGYYAFPRPAAFEFGVDVRDTMVHGNNASLNTFMVSLRIEGRPGERLRPYAQVGVGAGTSKAELSAGHTTRAEPGIFAGVDYALNKHVDFRVVEVGYGTLTTASSSVYGAHTNIPSANLINLSSGLVFRFR